MEAANTGRLRYNGLQASLQKRLSGGLSFVASYAFSKAIEYTAGSLAKARSRRTLCVGLIRHATDAGDK
ncbi:MAG: hypothetical protein ACREB3_00475, partial [Burkholderiales bacterium]